MRYLPHTGEDVASMLRALGARTLEALFENIPRECRRETALRLPEALTEWELDDHMARLAGSMAAGGGWEVFVGAGCYEHHIPALVPALVGRSEFVTSYTPYQPEVSQGTLQAIYEYQTLVTRLLGMDVANASMYDGASALAEALLMAVRITGKKKVVVSRLVHPLHRQVVRTYFSPTGGEVVELPLLEDGTTDPGPLEEMDTFAAVAVQSPNFMGCVEDLGGFAALAHEKEALCIGSFTEPLAYGLFKSPGSLGADIACGEGQSLGVPMSFGGPGLGMFACKAPHMRSLPGRLVGKTVDREGRQGFVLTLATREQHIRREKATSNICTNNSLCALAAAVYMAALGGTGFRELARLNRDKAEYLKARLEAAGCPTRFRAPTFNEFVARCPEGFEKKHRDLLGRKIVAGLRLEPYYPELSGHYLFCATETKSRESMDLLVSEMAS